MAVQDGSRYRPSRIGVPASGAVLARALREAWGESQKVGVLLPSYVGAASVNLAAALSGRVSVHLNFTRGDAAMHSVIRQASIQSVVTSRAFSAAFCVGFCVGFQISRAASGRVARSVTCVFCFCERSYVDSGGGVPESSRLTRIRSRPVSVLTLPVHPGGG